jgi:hypothetical protein
MSDPLAEMLAPILEHHVYNGEYGDCTCGWPGLDAEVRDSEQWSDHISPLIADTARAFVGDEIAAEHERLHSSNENVSEARQLRDAQWWHNGMVKAESIARGDTK